MTILAPMSSATPWAYEHFGASEILGIDRCSLLATWTFYIDRKTSDFHPVPSIKDGIVRTDNFGGPS